MNNSPSNGYVSPFQKINNKNNAPNITSKINNINAYSDVTVEIHKSMKGYTYYELVGMNSNHFEKFDFSVANDTLVVDFRTKQTNTAQIIKNTTTYSNCVIINNQVISNTGSSNGKVIIYVHTVFLDQVKFNTVSGNFKMSIPSNSVTINSTSGDVAVGEVYLASSINTVSGNIFIGVNAKNKINVNLNSVSGNISLKLVNVKSLTGKASTISGKYINTLTTNGIYEAYIKVTSVSGNITLSS